MGLNFYPIKFPKKNYIIIIEFKRPKKTKRIFAKIDHVKFNILLYNN